MILSSGHYCELGNLIKFSNHDYYQGRLYWIFEKLEIQFLAEVLNNLEKRLNACHVPIYHFKKVCITKVNICKTYGMHT